MGKIEGLDKLLAEHPFFKGLAPETVKLLAGCAKNERYGPGDFLAHEGDAADKFWFVRTGAVALEFPGPGSEDIIIETLHDGEVVGWSWLLEPYTWSCDIRALELTRLISIDAACLRKKMKKNATLGFDLYSRFAPLIAERLHNAHQQLTDMYAQKR